MKTKFKVIIIILLIVIFVGIAFYFSFINLTESNSKQSEKDRQQQQSSQQQNVTQKEILELTQDEVDLEIGAMFDFSQYIKIAQDRYGYNIKDRITIEGSVPTDKEGSYQIEYQMHIGDGKNLSRILKVNIKKF